MLYVLLRVTGIPLTEAQAVRSRGDGVPESISARRARSCHGFRAKRSHHEEDLVR